MIDQAQADYEAGRLPHSETTYDLISKAKRSQTAAVTAFQQYVELKREAGAADATAKAEFLRSAVQDVSSFAVAIQQLYVPRGQ